MKKIKQLLESPTQKKYLTMPLYYQPSKDTSFSLKQIVRQSSLCYQKGPFYLKYCKLPST